MICNDCMSYTVIILLNYVFNYLSLILFKNSDSNDMLEIKYIVTKIIKYLFEKYFLITLLPLRSFHQLNIKVSQGLISYSKKLPFFILGKKTKISLEFNHILICKLTTTLLTF